MGCWNGTCAVSNLHIRAGQDVAVFMLLENKQKKTFCYGNALYDHCPIPFYGEYNDYGGVENENGFGLDLIVEALRSQLYEFGLGPNSSHDIKVRKVDFDYEMMMAADHEDRLGIQDHDRWSQDSYDLNEMQTKFNEKSLTSDEQFELDRLAAKIKQEDTFRRVTHVMIHGDIFRSIMNDWYIENYVGDGKGNKGYGNNYTHLYFKDVKAAIPEYVARRKKAYDDAQAEKDPSAKFFKMREARRADWNDPNHAARYMRSFGSDSNMEYGLIDVDEMVEAYIEQGDWDGFEKFVTEVLTGSWINSFMAFTRKVWTQQTGMGSQNNEPIGYKVLANSVLSILKKEQDEYDAENGEDEDDFIYEDEDEVPHSAVGG